MQAAAVGAEKSLHQAGTAAPQPGLVRAAHEFEAMMMKELLKPMTGSDSITGEDDGSELGSAGALGEFASEALGKALSAGGGFGIAHEIVQSLSHSGNKSETGTVTRNLNHNTGIRTSE